MFPVPKDDHRKHFQDYQVLCNAEDGKVFRHPVVPKGEVLNLSSEDVLYLSNVNSKKVMVFEYETGVVGYWGLSEQIIAANLSTQEIINVVKAADEFGHYSKDDIKGLKECLEARLDHREDLMAWLTGKPVPRPTLFAPPVSNKGPANV